MDLKKIGKALLFPHVLVMVLLVPISTVLLVGSMVFIGTESVIAYVSYVLAAYTLTIWCMKIPNIISASHMRTMLFQDQSLSSIRNGKTKFAAAAAI